MSKPKLLFACKIADAEAKRRIEQYAEAVVELVEGRRTHLGGIILSDAAVAAVADWGSGAR